MCGWSCRSGPDCYEPGTIAGPENQPPPKASSRQAPKRRSRRRSFNDHTGLPCTVELLVYARDDVGTLNASFINCVQIDALNA